MVTGPLNAMKAGLRMTSSTISIKISSRLLPLNLVVVFLGPP